MLKFDNICRNVCSLVIEVGSYVYEERMKLREEDIIVKGLHNFVSYVDMTSEDMLKAGLRKIFLDAGFICEESGEDRRFEYNWVIDPLDGTTNYIHGMPFYSISVALMRREEVILGVVYDIERRNIYYSYEGLDCSYKNSDKIYISNVRLIEDALVGTGFPYSDFKYMVEYIELFKYFMEHSHGVRRPGSAALDLVLTGEGVFDIFYEYGLSSWDVAAGSFIVKQSGGIVGDFEGGENYIFGREIVATNRYLYKKVIELTKKYFKEKNKNI